MLIFYDFEVFKYDWLVVFIDPYEEKYTTIVDDPEQLELFYTDHQNDIFVGYNSKNYDQYILKGILCCFNPYKISDFIINKKNPGWQYSELLHKIRILNYDIAYMSDGGLKSLEAFLGNDICESSVPFEIDRPLTPEEIKETIKYCTHDVEQTIEVFMHRKEDFDTQMQLITTFGLPLSDISKTQTQLTAKILNCVYEYRNDEFNVDIVPCLRLSKYKFVLDWFMEALNVSRQTGIYQPPLQTKISDVEHIFAWAGLHGARRNYHAKGLFLHVDVTSYYPSEMLEFGFLTRNSTTPERYRSIYETRVALKAAGKKKEQAPYKLVLNKTFGATKDKHSAAYDPKRFNDVCINGQLLALDLIEKLEIIPGFELIQSNTDGLIIKIPDTDEAFEAADDICWEWESRTGMRLGFDVITEIWQGDVNNYVFKFANGKIERKGSYVQEATPLKNNLAIVNTALVEYMVNGIPIETTINACDDVKQFQMVVKVSSKYESAWYNGKRLREKTFRIFASTDQSNGTIYKQKKTGATKEKFASAPDHCIIYNQKITPETKIDIDKRWYIELAKQRVVKFGV